MIVPADANKQQIIINQNALPKRIFRFFDDTMTAPITNRKMPRYFNGPNTSPRNTAAIIITNNGDK
jgi:hypothetical protein